MAWTRWPTWPPSRTPGTPAPVVFGNNTVATFTVLWTAAELGVRRLVIAGSVNATGLLENPHRPLPPRLPHRRGHAADIADPYSLSKHTDEATLRAVCRRFEASGVALRLPLMVSPANAAELRRVGGASRSRMGVGDGWGWLDVRDGAEAFRLALDRGVHGRARGARGGDHDVPGRADRGAAGTIRAGRARRRRPIRAAWRPSTPAALDELLGFRAPVRHHPGARPDAHHDAWRRSSSMSDRSSCASAPTRVSSAGATRRSSIGRGPSARPSAS